MSESPHIKTRVLIETPHEDVRSEHAFVLREAGYEVVTCAGPDEPCGHCPLVDDGRCALVDEADVVITTPHLQRGHEILAALTGTASPVVIVEGGAPELQRERAVLRDARVLPLPVRADELIGAVKSVVRPRTFRYWEDFTVGETTLHGTYRLSQDEIVDSHGSSTPSPFISTRPRLGGAHSVG